MPIYTVSQISEAIKKTLEGSFGSLQIKGEISNLRLQSSGHYYFTLKDENAQISCALFRGDAARLKASIKDGDQILALGSISVFAPKGTYQLIVKDIQLQGLGDLLMKLEALKAKFKQKGYFDTSLKKPIPKYPKRIGVVTSATGAVIQDIIQTLNRRHKGFKLLLVPTKVQGDGSAKEIAYALDILNQYQLCDVIICGRGGGSLEDLWCFNEEDVVEAIYRSKIPVISAVGHETDFTLADFVADLRAPTPTAAAEMALFDTKEFYTQIHSRFESIFQLVKRKLLQEKKLFSQIKKRPEFCSSSFALQGFYFSLDKFVDRFTNVVRQSLLIKKKLLSEKSLSLVKLNPDQQLKARKSTLELLKQKLAFRKQDLLKTHLAKLQTHNQRLIEKTVALIQAESLKLDSFKQVLDSISPDNVLKKGYAILEAPSGQTTYTSVYQIPENEDIRLKLKDGSAIVKLKNKSLI